MQQPDTWLDYLTAFSTAVAAIGTLAAVVFALYLNVWRERRRRPDLSMALHDDSNMAVAWTPGTRHSTDAWGFSVLVANARGRTTAHDVQVLVTLARREPEGWVDLLTDQLLIWKLRRAPLGEGDVSIDIPAGVKRKLFVAFIGEGNAVFRSMYPHEVAWGGIVDEDGCLYEVVAGGHTKSSSPPVAGVLATYPFTQTDDPFWLWRDEQVRLRLTVTSHDSDAVTYEALVTLKFTLRTDQQPPETNGPSIEPVWEEFRRVGSG